MRGISDAKPSSMSLANKSAFIVKDLLIASTQCGIHIYQYFAKKIDWETLIKRCYYTVASTAVEGGLIFTGIALGLIIGSFLFPGLGTVIGAFVGAISGVITAGLVGPELEAKA